jgi:CubicO group peptidase (beta-lactamase class C family)
MAKLESEVDALAADGFSGVVSVSTGDAIDFEKAYGLADRAHRIPVDVETQLAIASGTKGFTALTVASLITDGVLALSTTARSVLGPDLPLIATDVTVEHLLGHTSGIGDYIDEETDSDDEYVMKVPVHTLATAEGYVAALDGFAAKFAAGERFAYSNAGYVVLALMAQRRAGQPFHDLVAERVLRPAGMSRTEFFRMDDLPGTAALGYLADGRTNVLHMPVRGSGDGGAYTTAADLRAFWAALFAGRIVEPAWVLELTRPRRDVPDEGMRYGAGFWLAAAGPQVVLVGGDNGVGFYSSHNPETGRTCTVMRNCDGSVLAIARRLEAS